MAWTRSGEAKFKCLAWELPTEWKGKEKTAIVETLSANVALDLTLIHFLASLFILTTSINIILNIYNIYNIGISFVLMFHTFNKKFSSLDLPILLCSIF